MSAAKSGSHSNPVKPWKLNKRKTVKQVSAFSAVHYDFIIKFPVQVEGKCLLAFHVNSLLKKVRYIVYSFYASPPFIVHREQEIRENFFTRLAVKRMKQVAKALLH